MNSRKNRSKKSGTRRKHVNTHTFAAFQKEVTVVFLEMLMMVKLYHWKTTSYATHKATDKLYTKLNANFDSFIEILLGKSGSRTDLMSEKHIKLMDLNSPEVLKQAIISFKGYLISLDDNKKFPNLMTNTDLFNIRDTILGDLNQFLYLLTFK